jgi:hypothetical protein
MQVPSHISGINLRKVWGRFRASNKGEQNFIFYRERCAFAMAEANCA